MDILFTLDEAYAAYLQSAAELNRQTNRPAGMFQRLLGSGRNPGDAQLNPDFYHKIEGILQAFAAESPDSATVRAAAEKMFSLAAAHADNGVAKWMLIAVQGLLAPLVPCLSAEDRAALAQAYAAQYPRSERFPTQETLYHTLISS
ncbi:MAG: hypothetical protein LKJ90_02140 [Faecalibacterium sp.]|jgi:hypothetical protein|nr:hypothetical protein [Faecalibacterium sp.]